MSDTVTTKGTIALTPWLTTLRNACAHALERLSATIGGKMSDVIISLAVEPIRRAADVILTRHADEYGPARRVTYAGNSGHCRRENGPVVRRGMHYSAIAFHYDIRRQE